MPHRDMALAPRATWRPYPERGPCRCSRYLLHAAPALPAPLPSLSSHENANLKAPAESRLQSVTGGFRSVYFSSARLCAKLEVNGPRLSKSTISLLLVLGHVLQRRNTHYTFCTTHFNFTGFELCPGEPRTLGQGHSLRDAAGYRLSSKDTSAHPILRKLPDLELLCKKTPHGAQSLVFLQDAHTSTQLRLSTVHHQQVSHSCENVWTERGDQRDRSRRNLRGAGLPTRLWNHTGVETMDTAMAGMDINEQRVWQNPGGQ